MSVRTDEILPGTVSKCLLFGTHGSNPNGGNKGAFLTNRSLVGKRQLLSVADIRGSTAERRELVASCPLGSRFRYQGVWRSACDVALAWHAIAQGPACHIWSNSREL